MVDRMPIVAFVLTCFMSASAFADRSVSTTLLHDASWISTKTSDCWGTLLYWLVGGSLGDEGSDRVSVLRVRVEKPDARR